VEEQAPVWFLRLRQAVVDRGATLVMAGSRSTKMHRYARAIHRYEPGRAPEWAQAQTADLVEDARNLLIVFGDEHLDGPRARALAQSLANLLIETNHAGKANSGLLALYPHANTQGVFDLVVSGQGSGVSEPTTDVAWMIGVGDGADAPQAKFAIVQDILMTELAKNADVVLPALSFAEREGSFTSGDRRVQRFYRALPPIANAKPDWWIVSEVAKRLGHAWGLQGPAHIFADIARNVPHYSALSYNAISQSEVQWPPMGRGDLYYGGTVYDNTGGIGARYAADAESSAPAKYDVSVPEPTIAGLERAPQMLYRDSELIRRSKVVESHIVPIREIA
jgi:NADH-quinone oxidoreductase subunit G